jgi:hypothetical protein
VKVSGLPATSARRTTLSVHHPSGRTISSRGCPWRAGWKLEQIHEHHVQLLRRLLRSATTRARISWG